MNTQHSNKTQLNVDESLTSKIKDTRYEPIDLDEIEKNKTSLHESLAKNKIPLDIPSLSKITANIQLFKLSKDKALQDNLNTPSINKPKPS